MISSTRALRAAVTGLIGLAATEEEMLLATAPDGEQGSPQRWAALPLVAHDTEFRQQQAARLEAVRRGQAPPGFAEIDHRSLEIYRRYSAASAAEVISVARQSAAALIDGLGAVSDADLGVPGMALGMAAYSLACAQAQAGATGDALHTLTEAITLNQDLRANARKDPDLAQLRDRGRLGTLAHLTTGRALHHRGPWRHEGVEPMTDHKIGGCESPGHPLSPTERTRHRRLRALGRTDRQSLHAVLEAGLVAHLGVIIDGWPMVIPTCYGFTADTLYLHGSVASQSLNTAGTPVCVTITVADGLVLARSVFEHTINCAPSPSTSHPGSGTTPAARAARKWPLSSCWRCRWTRRR
jgi:hypothetical protein